MQRSSKILFVTDVICAVKGNTRPSIMEKNGTRWVSKTDCSICILSEGTCKLYVIRENVLKRETCFLSKEISCDDDESYLGGRASDI